MTKTVIEQLRGIKTLLSELLKDQQLQEGSGGGGVDLTDPTHPKGHCGLTIDIQTRKDFVDALDKIRLWLEHMITVLESNQL